MLLLALTKGLLLMSSVIIAIGPQNAFLLRQSVRHEKAWLVASIFLIGDVMGILLGGFGIGHFLERWPVLKLALTILGVIYIFWFGVGVLRQMNIVKTLSIVTPEAGTRIVAGALAVTFLNPHVMLDTVVLIGTMALQFQSLEKTAFMSGAILASVIWFFGIAWMGQRLAPFLSRPDVWRVIDCFIVVVMFLMSLTLATQAWHQAQALSLF